jgi:hypothetical protein
MNIHMTNGLIAESMFQNYLRAAGLQPQTLTETDAGEVVSSDIGQYGPLILPLVQKIYPESLVAQIASVQPTTSPIAKIAAMYSSYSGQDENIVMDNSWIVSIPAVTPGTINVGDTGANLSAGFTVFYVENSQEYMATFGQAGPFSPGAELTRGFPDKYTHLLVRSDNGFARTGDTFTINAVDYVLSYVSSNRNVIKRIFQNYSNVLESNTDLRQVNFEIRTSNIETQTRKILSKFTPEMLQDWSAIYKEKTNELVATFIAEEVRQEIDREVVTYLKNIATPMLTDVDVTQSIAKAGSDLSGMTYDIFLAIFLAIEEIVRATKRNRTMFILADSTTCAFMALNALQTSVDATQSNPYLIGKVGTYPLFCDPYSTEHYVLVGYRYDSDSKDDAGLIYSPYTSTIVEVTDQNTFATNFVTMNRYGYTRHPQDAGTGSGDSDFFRYFAVNYYDAFSPIANLGNQIRTEV